MTPIELCCTTDDNDCKGHMQRQQLRRLLIAVRAYDISPDTGVDMILTAVNDNYEIKK